MHSRVTVAIISTIGAIVVAVVSSVSTVAAVGDRADGSAGVSRAEVRTMIQHESPYVQDRRYILAGIERIERELQILRRAVQTP